MSSPKHREDPHRIDLDLCVAALRLLGRERAGYEVLRKHVIRVTQCGSPGKVDRAIRDLVANGWIEKTGPARSRTPYRITEAGRLFLKSMA